MASKLTRIGVAAAAVIVAMALVSIAAAHLPFVRARVFNWARAQVAQSYGVSIEADELRYNLFTTSVELRNPSLSTGREPPFFRAESLRVALNRSVLWGTVRVERLALVRPRVTIVRHADGTTNLPASRTEPPSSASSPLNLGVIDLRQLSVEIQDEAANRALRAGPIDLTLDSNSANPATGAFGPAAFTVTARETLSGTAGGRLGFDGTRLSVAELNVETPEGRLALSGWIDLLAETLNVNAQGTLDVNLARAARFVDLAAPTPAGSARAQFTIGGTAVDPSLRFVITGQDLAYRSIAGATLTANASYAAGRLAIDAFEVTSPFGTASISGELPVTATAGAPGTSRLLGRIENVRLDPLLDASGVTLPLPLGSSASGEFNLALDGADPFAAGWLQHLTAQGSVALKSLGSGAAVSGQIGIQLANANWTIAHALQSATGRASLSGQASGRIRSEASSDFDSTLAGRSRLRLDDLAAARQLLLQAGVDMPPSIERISGSLEASIEPGGTIASPRAVATLSGHAIQVAEFPPAELAATIALDRRQAHAQSLEATLGRTRLAASGSYTWEGQIKTRFVLTADDLDALAKAFDPGSMPIAGAATLEGSVEGTVESPRSRSTLTAERLSIDGTPVGTLSATLDLADWRLAIDARAPDIAAELRGDVDTREPFAYRAEARLNKTSVPALVPVSQRPSIPITDGTISADLRAHGDLRRPLESTGDLNLQDLSVSVSGIPIVLDAPARVAIGPDVITATPILLRAGKATQLHLRGALARTGSREGLEVRLDGTLSDLLEMAATTVPDLRLGADGRINMDVRIGGTIEAPDPSGTISLQASAISHADLPPLTDVALAARIDRGQISLQSLTASWQQAKLLAEGSVPLRMIAPDLTMLPAGQTTAAMRARITNITPAALAPFAEPSQLEQIAGTVAATVTVEADTFALDGIRAAVVLDDASLTLAGVPFAQSVPTRLRLEGGAARIESLRWNAEGNELLVSGGAHLAGPAPTVDLAVTGDVDLRILGAFASDISPGGVARANVSVKGPIAAPEIVGSVAISAGELGIDAPPFAASDFDGTVSVAADGMATIDLKGLINGGSATVTGSASLKDWSDPRGRVILTARNVMLDYPDGFQTESNADLTLTVAGPGSTLSGRIEVLNGIYRQPIVLSRGLLAGLTSSDVVTPESASSFLANLRLDVAVASTEAVRIDNNYGRLNLAADLRITGSANRPGAVGRIEALPDGELYVLGNTYRVQDLIVDLENPVAIAPDLTFRAETRVNNVPVELALTCTAAGVCEREVRSQLTGVTNEQAEAMLFGNVADPAEAGAQLARLLSGEVLGIVGQTVGLDTLRLEVGTAGGSDLFEDPSLLAGDVNPASRLTFGKRLGERVELAYSQDLAENGFTTSTSFFAPWGISLRALLLDDQSRSYEFRHEPRFGGQPQRRSQPPPRQSIAGISIVGTPGFSEDELRDELRLTEGNRYDFVKWQEDRGRLKAWYRSRGFFEATVRARRLPAEAAGSIVLEYEIERGRPTQLEISGVSLPDTITNRIVDRWTGAIFDRFLERDVTLIVREHLYREGRLRAKVATVMQVDDADRAKTLRVDVDPGPILTPRLEFEGNSEITTSRLTEASQSTGMLAAWLDPDFFTLVIEKLYREQGLLSAEVSVREPEIRDADSIVRVVIREGGPWKVRRVTLGGADVLEDGAAPGSQAPLAGSRYDPNVISAHIADLERRFRAAGFLDVRVVAETVLDEQERAADVHVLAAPGPRSVLSSVAVEGASPDNPLIARSVTLGVGMPVDPAAVSDTRRRLYDTGVYRRVDIDLEPNGAAGEPAGGPSEGDRQVTARVHVEERQRWTFRYGFQLNDEVVAIDERTQRFGFSADMESRNVLGLGTTVGVSARLRRDQQIGRVFVGANRFFGLPLRSNLFLSRSREEIGADALRTVSQVTEVSFEQTYRLRRFIDLRYGYGLGHNRTTFTGSDFDLSVRVARLTSSGIVDRRSDPFNPARGWFAAASLETSRPGLGSDISFLKTFQQYFHFIPVGSKVVIASAARAGLARTFRDEDLIPSERFFAGGATSVRGYRNEDLGPRNVFNEAAGGRALFIGNGEVRFPVYRWVKGVGFVDLGNVFETIGDFSLSDLQIGTGAGIRLDTPIGLLRLDVAAPANPRPIDPKWTAYVGLGHAF
jgi:outer membrane protein assembly factor BamA/autotransporter translocation and assembly factor TamB